MSQARAFVSDIIASIDHNKVMGVLSIAGQLIATLAIFGLLYALLLLGYGAGLPM